ncbi:UBP-type zinc finger domain-containing protein [Fibrella forsythiae]|uniref:UBP-type zinc finger domain-containing protein n=1 Tax=Fibrella forsythiae TaxID=2817061 RepID=A0ABS3JH44_9BACT|nr:UBP-type zinc finger domain-containing protein [Fibrella forsythiae]MBO0949323.1 UBP-type zinc finger domain-containing protein [Fibrella forsythiae]
MIRPKPCDELSTLTAIKTAAVYVCEECVKTGATWVHLRTCQTCGKTHCCDSSPNKHATKHFLATQHPVVSSAEPGEQWVWCFVHEQMAGY